MPKFTWSYSAVKDFETCPRQYEAKRILKLYPFVETAATRYGKELHKAIEMYGKHGTPIPKKFDFAVDAVKTVQAIEGTQYWEKQLALNEAFAPCAYRDKQVWWRGQVDFMVLNSGGTAAHVIDWKGLAIDTPIPTPTGWSIMADIQQGDEVFGADGKPCKVIHKSQIKNIGCYKVRFTNGGEVVCDAEHLWGLVGGAVVPVTTLSPHDKVPLTAPVQYPEAKLPIDPYVLGFWLADGKRTSGEVCKADNFMFQEVERRGYSLGANTYRTVPSGPNGMTQTRTIKGIYGALRDLRVIGNKHIPSMYLTAGYQQRLDLLRGLMDGDGNVNHIRKQAIFTSVSRRLSDDTLQLASSLGYRVLQSEVVSHGFGKEVTAYPLSFRPRGEVPFLLPRKAHPASLFGSGREYLEVESVESVPSVPTQCIEVDSPDNLYLCTHRYIPTHNTGKSSYADPDQLELMAMGVFRTFPKVRRVKAGLLFLQEGVFIPEAYTADLEEEYWKKWLAKLRVMDEAHTSGVFNPKPSGLCRAHCPVVTCPHNGNYKG